MSFDSEKFQSFFDLILYVILLKHIIYLLITEMLSEQLKDSENHGVYQRPDVVVIYVN